MKLAIPAALAAAMSVLCVAAAHAGERSQCHVSYGQSRCDYTYRDCRVRCGNAAFHNGKRNHRVGVYHFAPSHAYNYARYSETGGGYESQNEREYDASLSMPTYAPAWSPPVATGNPPFTPAPAAPVFNFYGPTNNFFGPVYGLPFSNDGSAPPQADGGDQRLDPWRGYNPNNGLENGY